MSMESILAGHRFVPVLAFTSVGEALAVSEVLLRAGLPLLEITLRTPEALDCISAVAGALPEARVGVGTIVDPEQVGLARAAGAVFGVSPGFSPALAAAARQHDLPFLPGVATVSEALAARALGFSTLKFFPAEAGGGVRFLNSVKGVLPDLAFCPTGGVNPGNAAQYLALPNVRAIGGSWLVQRDSSGVADLDATRVAAEACRSLAEGR